MRRPRAKADTMAARFEDVAFLPAGESPLALLGLGFAGLGLSRRHIAA
jgi:hypothetical protein